MIRPRPTTAQAELDRRDYLRFMVGGRPDLCLAIEQRHGLDGFPPEVVSVGLSAAAAGQDVDAAVTAYIEGVPA